MPISEMRLRWIEDLSHGPAPLSTVLVEELIAAIRELQQPASVPLVERSKVLNLIADTQRSVDNKSRQWQNLEYLYQEIRALPAVSPPSEV